MVFKFCENYFFRNKFYKKILKVPIDIFYLVDCGCDFILNGSETNLATFVEDIMHLKAISELSNINKLFVCANGLNVDCGDGVLENELSDRIEYLKRKNI